MNGVVDFSLVPIALFENINIDYGGSGALFGSGAVGSIVHINSHKKLTKGWLGKLLLGGGSFGNFSQQAELGFGNKKRHSSLAVIHSKADNNFDYIYNNKKGRQSNSAFNQFAIHQDNIFQLSDNQFIKTFIWHQTTDRQIAPRRHPGSERRHSERSIFPGWNGMVIYIKMIFNLKPEVHILTSIYCLKAVKLIVPKVIRKRSSLKRKVQ